MKAIRDNYPIIIGWLIYLISAVPLSIKYPDGISSLFSKFSNELWSSIFSIIVFAFVDYLRFLISAQWIALPIFKSMKKITQKSKLKFLVLEWFHFSFWVFLCVFPVSNYSYLIPASWGVREIIVLIWSVIISFWAYNGVVSDYVFSMTKTTENIFEKVVV